MSAPDKRLPCGVDVEDLVRQVFEGAEPRDADHQRGCPHCQAALRRIRRAHEDMQGLAAEPVRVPGGILNAVMARIRAKTALVTVDVGTRGSTMVADRLIAEVARRAALGVEAVERAAVVAAEEDPAGVVGLRVRLIVAYGPSLPEVADAVRAAVAGDVARFTGATTRSIDVSIDDID